MATDSRYMEKAHVVSARKCELSPVAPNRMVSVPVLVCDEEGEREMDVSGPGYRRERDKGVVGEKERIYVDIDAVCARLLQCVPGWKMTASTKQGTARYSSAPTSAGTAVGRRHHPSCVYTVVVST